MICSCLCKYISIFIDKTKSFRPGNQQQNEWEKASYFYGYETLWILEIKGSNLSESTKQNAWFFGNVTNVIFEMTI